MIVEVSGPEGESLLAVDSPFDRQGPETALVEAEAPGTYRVTMRSREPAANAGRTTIRIDRLAPEPRRLAAERAMTEASESGRQVDVIDLAPARFEGALERLTMP